MSCKKELKSTQEELKSTELELDNFKLDEKFKGNIFIIKLESIFKMSIPGIRKYIFK